MAHEIWGNAEQAAENYLRSVGWSNDALDYNALVQAILAANSTPTPLGDEALEVFKAGDKVVCVDASRVGNETSCKLAKLAELRVGQAYTVAEAYDYHTDWALILKEIDTPFPLSWSGKRFCLLKDASAEFLWDFLRAPVRGDDLRESYCTAIGFLERAATLIETQAAQLEEAEGRIARQIMKVATAEAELARVRQAVDFLLWNLDRGKDVRDCLEAWDELRMTKEP